MNLLPIPRRVEARDGTFDLRRASAIVATDDPGDVASWLADELRSTHGIDLPRRDSGGDGAIVLELRDEGSVESYTLEVTGERITLEAQRPAGLFHAAQTLLQLADETPLPCLHIEDAPRFRWRGVHLDVCRHFFPVEFVKRFIDVAARHKLNIFHWHLTEDQGWRIEVPAYPKLTEVSAWRAADGARYGGFYTAADVREVVEYARRRSVTVVPEIELPGHSLAALAAYPELSCSGGPFEVETRWGIFDDVYCAGNDATLRFLEGVLEHVLALFPSPFVHIGGDEVPKTRWRECPRCQARMRDEGLTDEAELQSGFVGHFARWLDERGRRLVGWDEILEGGLPAGATVMSWRGVEPAYTAAAAGHDVVLTPTSHCYFDYAQTRDPEEPGNIGMTALETVHGFEPVPTDLDETLRGHVLGVQGNIWTEHMATPERVEYMTFPRLCALAEVAWSDPAGRSWGDFRRRLQGHLARLDRLGIGYRPLD